MSNSRRHNWFGLRLKQAREDAGLSQEQLAEKLDVSRLTVVRWETGKLKPGFDRLEPIAEATGQALAWFFETSTDAGLASAVTNLQERVNQLETILQSWPDRIAEAVAQRLKER